MNFICISLFKLFINNNASLNNLNIYMNDYHYNCDFLLEIFELILNNSKFITEIENLTLKFYVHNEPPKFDVQILLATLPSLLSSIKHLDIYVKNGLSTKNLPYLIRSQTQLSSLTLSFMTSNVLDAFKCFSNTLTSIKFNICDLTNILSFDGLRYLTQLKSLQFIGCKGLTTQVFQPLLDIPTLKIRSLKIDDSQTSGIDLLIQKVGSYLEHLELSLDKCTERKNAFKSIVDYCDKIQFLYLDCIWFEDIPQIFKIITHLGGHLKYLYLENSYSYIIQSNL